MEALAQRAAVGALLCALPCCAACTGQAAAPSTGGGTVTSSAGSSAPERSEPSVEPSPTTRTSLTPAPPAATTSAPAPVATAQVDWPEEAVPHHGGRYWAVYLEVARPGTEQAELAAAIESARGVGYQTGIGSIGCEVGAVEALALDPDISYQAVSIFFDSAGDAETFVELYQPGVVGTAYVTALCMD